MSSLLTEENSVLKPIEHDTLCRIFRGKLNAHDRHRRFSLTPGPDDGWDTEVQGDDIPIESFGDTRDKMVLHPGHLGYSYDYYWGRGSWGEQSCWDTSVSEEEQLKAASEMLNIVALALIKLKFKVVRAFVNGTNKGKLYSGIAEITEDDFIMTLLCNEEPEPVESAGGCVLFVFGLTNEFMETYVK